MRVLIFVITFVFLFSLQVNAGIRPSFSLGYSSWYATDIVVATEGEEIDGKFTVLETIKGNLKNGEIIAIKQFATFKLESSRQVKEFESQESIEPAKYVSGAKMILFLKKNPNLNELWESSDIIFKVFNTSVLWIEGNETFAFIQTRNPGASVLINYGKSESEVRKIIPEILQRQSSLNETLKIENKTKRAKELAKFTTNDFYPTRKAAFEELENCGKDALSVLRKMLNDQSLFNIHPNIMKSLTKIGGQGAGNELTDIVKEELSFWKANSPKLKGGWWNDLNNPGTETLRNHYGKVLEAIYQLKNLKFVKSKKVIIEFRDFWRSLPQLEDKSGLNQMSEECDNLLKVIS